MNKAALTLMIILSCIMIFPPISMAIDFMGMGGRISAVLPKGDAGTTVGFGAIVDLGPIISKLEPLKAEISVNYWGNSYDTAGSSWKTNLTSVSFNGTAKLYIPLSVKIFPFIGGGLGIDVERWTSEDSSANASVGSGSDSNTGLITHLVAGFDVPLGSSGFKFTPKAEYNMSRTDTFQIVGALVLMFK